MLNSLSSLSPIPTQFDVIVVGAGAAGLYATLCLPETFRVGLIAKDSLRTGASEWAQGGIAAAIAPEDSPTFHQEDTLKAGVGLCDRAAVDFLVNHAAISIHRLVEMGVAFDRKGETLAMTLEAAHSHPRVLHAADTTGRAIVSTLTARVLQQPNIQVLSEVSALSLWLDPQTGRCRGVSLLWDNQIRWIQSRATILATGGGGQVYAQTTNPTVSTGDGVALAWRGGAKLRDLEFFQFHPTALTVPNAPHFLISEAVRGEGAHLIDGARYRFAFDYHPKGELAPRDVVSRGIFQHLEKTAADPAKGRVYLDLTPIDPDRIRYRFPNIIQVCQRWGVDAFRQPIPVAPAAHYWMGGVAVDLQNQTSISGLYAIGETASTGVHGANRLASNSLLECIVYAAQLSDLKLGPQPSAINSPPPLQDETDYTAQAATLTQVRGELQRLMWHSAGICRQQQVLEDAIAQVQAWREDCSQLPVARYFLQPKPCQTVIFAAAEAPKHLRVCAETFNLLDIAYLILHSAALRQESRGGHYRSDYPQPSAQWQVHTLVERDRWYTAPVDG